MKSNIKKIIRILSVILYYLLLICFLIFNPYIISIIYYSDVLLIVFFSIPIVLAFVPFILIKKMHINKLKSFIYSLLVAIILFVLMIIIGYLTDNYFKNFSSEKWNNNNYCDIRYKMIDSLEMKYSLVGMSKNNIYQILGTADSDTCLYDYEKDNKICYMIFETIMDYKFYCLYFDEVDNVVDTELVEVK
jgi:hypothetical protein